MLIVLTTLEEMDPSEREVPFVFCIYKYFLVQRLTSPILCSERVIKIARQPDITEMEV